MREAKLAALVAVATLALVACGGDEAEPTTAPVPGYQPPASDVATDRSLATREAGRSSERPAVSCTFEWVTEFDSIAKTVSMGLDTDLPDDVSVSVSASRIYSVRFEDGRAEDYSCSYLSEVGVPVQAWRVPRALSLDSDVCRAEIDEHQSRFDELAAQYREQDMPEIAAEMAFSVESIAEEVDLHAVQVFGQGVCPDPTEDQVTLALPL